MGPNNFFRRFRSNSSSNNYYIANNYPTGTTASEPKSKTKLLIIVVIVAVVLISIFAIIGSIGKKSQKVDKDVIAAVNSYANWILYGKDSDDEPSSLQYDPENLYYLDELIDNDNRDEAFFENAFKKLDRILELTNDEDYYVQTNGLAFDYSGYILVFKEILNNGELEPSDIEQYYYEKGEEKTLQYVDNFYGKFSQDNSSVKSYVDRKKELAENIVKRLELYREYSCDELPGFSACIFSDEALEEVNDLSRSIEAEKNQDIWTLAETIEEQSLVLIDITKEEDNNYED